MIALFKQDANDDLRIIVIKLPHLVLVPLLAFFDFQAHADSLNGTIS
jgi:hypothetical protein